MARCWHGTPVQRPTFTHLVGELAAAQSGMAHRIGDVAPVSGAGCETSTQPVSDVGYDMPTQAISDVGYDMPTGVPGAAAHAAVEVAGGGGGGGGGGTGTGTGTGTTRVKGGRTQTYQDYQVASPHGAQDYQMASQQPPQDMFEVHARPNTEDAGTGVSGRGQKGTKGRKAKPTRNSKHAISLKAADTGGMMMNPMMGMRLAAQSEAGGSTARGAPRGAQQTQRGGGGGGVKNGVARSQRPRRGKQASVYLGFGDATEAGGQGGDGAAAVGTGAGDSAA